MGTDDAMGQAMEEALRKKVNTDKVVAYLKILAAEHIDGGYEDDERDWSEEMDVVWDTMTQAEKDTTNDLVERVFGEWVGA